MIRPFFELFNFSRSKPLLAAALMAVLISPNQALADLGDWGHSGIIWIYCRVCGLVAVSYFSSLGLFLSISRESACALQISLFENLSVMMPLYLLAAACPLADAIFHQA